MATEPNHPGEKLLLKLEELRKRLNNSGVERTIGLKGAMGDNCTYFRKSLDIFIKSDWDDLEKLINECGDYFQDFKGK